MKKKLLTTAMLAALGGVGTAHAVNVNPDGLGQVLLFPYYTVQNGFVTSVHITNTTSQVKAVKVRFLEGKNSNEVLDFNLYLSPYDVWAGRIVGGETGAARLESTDTSCITPRQLPEGGEAFRNILFDGDDAPNDSLERTREGYVEVIEMGTLDPDSAPGEYAVHDASGVPDSCSDLVSAEDGFSQSSLSVPTGGLFGTGHLIAVNSGIRTSYDAVAIDNFANESIWFEPGDESPSLNRVSADIPAIVVDGTDIYADMQPNLVDGTAVDKVSAVLMKSAINNEYAIDAGRDSKTDWIVTFPTKRFYVNQSPAAAPFSESWDPEVAESCDSVSFEYWDREEQERVPSQGDFSPTPEAPGFELCNEVNTLTLYRDGSSPSDGQLFGAEWTDAYLAIENGFDAGWMRMAFDGDDASLVMFDDVTGELDTFVGLPVIGFAAMSTVNQVSVEIDGLTVYSAYMGSVIHKSEIDASSAGI